MTYEEFKEEFLSSLAQKSAWGISKENIQYYQDGLTADGDEERLKFIHNTNIRYHQTEADVLIGDYVVISEQKCENILSENRFYINQLFEVFQKNGWDRIWEIVKDSLEVGRRTEETGILEQMSNYEAVKEHLIIRPINYNDHRYELKDCIYKQVGDIALVLYVIIYDNKVQGLGTAKVPKSVFEEWELELDIVWENALLNTNVTAPPRMYMTPMECYNPPYTKGAFMAVGSKEVDISGMMAPIITTTRQTNGAIALFYPGVKERLAQLAKGSFYVAFTSIHEAKVHPEGTIPPLQVLRNLKGVNKAFDPTEILSRKVFYYDAEKETFTALEL